MEKVKWGLFKDKPVEEAIAEIERRLKETTDGHYVTTRYSGGFSYNGPQKIVVDGRTDPHYGEPINVLDILGDKEQSDKNGYFLSRSKYYIEYLLKLNAYLSQELLKAKQDDK